MASQASLQSQQDAISYRPLAARHLSWEELLEMAHGNLRCIEWENITKALMSGSTCGAADEGLSRPVRHGEHIDYFMSHSWHDDAKAKWDALRRCAEQFKVRHGRYPTFWLDKVCIDQENIADGLRALPVNVMACDKMLVLCGDTYAHRLWCIWEIFTLLAFTDVKALAVGTSGERCMRAPHRVPAEHCTLL